MSYSSFGDARSKSAMAYSSLRKGKPKSGTFRSCSGEAHSKSGTGHSSLGKVKPECGMSYSSSGKGTPNHEFTLVLRRNPNAHLRSLGPRTDFAPPAALSMGENLQKNFAKRVFFDPPRWSYV